MAGWFATWFDEVASGLRAKHISRQNLAITLSLICAKIQLELPAVSVSFLLSVDYSTGSDHSLIYSHA